MLVRPAALRFPRSASARDCSRFLEQLKLKASACLVVQGKKITFALWAMKYQGPRRTAHVIAAQDVIKKMK